MIGMKVNEAKGAFFDRKAVMNALDKRTRQVFSRFGAYTRTIARNLMKRKKGTSTPGQAPFAHVGLIKDFLFFVLDASSRSVVIGPALLNKRNNDTLAVLEHGGTTKRRGKPAHYEARPFMAPAFTAAKAMLPDLWRNSVKG